MLNVYWTRKAILYLSTKLTRMEKGIQKNPPPINNVLKLLTTLVHRIAILVQDYHDMCQGTHQIMNGITALSIKLLEKSGYNVLTVPYNEFSTSDKLLKRVQYLEAQLKQIVNKNNNNKTESKEH
jgi:hypothetical protein